MSNMSYCRFQNTATDLRECYDWLAENDLSKLSEDERKAFERLVHLCQLIVEDYGDDMGISA